MKTYLTEVLAEKKFVGNVVIKINDVYYSIRQPDSGLVIPNPYDRLVQGLILNPTQIDLRRISTTIASYSFKLVDKDRVITAPIAGDASSFIRQSVEIWLGRSGVGMDFADYFKLPVTKIKKVDYAENGYNFSSAEATDRMGQPIYDQLNAIGVDILAATTTITMRDDLSNYPTAGLIKVENEFISYTGIDTVNNRLTGCIRGEVDSVPADHAENTDAYQAEHIIDNPINIILKILTSGGGGSSYDVLRDGLAIDSSLIDITAMEALRDQYYPDTQYDIVLTNEESALRVMEDEILMPLNLRFKYSNDNSTLSLAILDRAEFVDEDKIITEDSIISYPKWSVDGNKIVNQVTIEWDYDEPTTTYLKRNVYSDATSIAAYEAQDALSFQFKGIKSNLDGQNIVDTFADNLLRRLSVPSPEIAFSTHVDKSLQTIGDKTRLVSSQVPSFTGDLSFANDVEVISRAINFQTGEVNFKLAFASYTNQRSCFIAPSDLIQSVVSQKKVILAAGRGDYYSVGWKMRLFDASSNTYTSDAVNTITQVLSDTIVFENDFVTTLTGPNNFRLKFCDYDDAVDSQKRYCFIDDGENNFDDGGLPYRITF